MPAPARHLIDRLMEKLTYDHGCWTWTAKAQTNGYGAIQRGKAGEGVVRTHRAAYQLLVAPIPDGLHLDHLCRNTLCCNPMHLEPVTPAENLRRSAAKEGRAAQAARITSCPRGHAYTSENIKEGNGNRRACRECARIYQRAYMARKRERRAA